MKAYRRQISSFLVPSLILAGLTVLFVLISLHFLSGNLEHSKKAELGLHADRVASALKAQLFERYADSQAFALNPHLISALTDPSRETLLRAQETLDRLVILYKVYDYSILTDRTGRVVTKNSVRPDGRPVEQRPWSKFPGKSTDFWQAQADAANTQIDDFDVKPPLASFFGNQPVQSFSSPLLSAKGERIGVITNYTLGLYIEREMNLMRRDLARLKVPLSRILLKNESQKIIGILTAQGYSHLPGLANDDRMSKVNINELTENSEMFDERLANSPRWQVQLVVDRKRFLSEVDRLRWISYLVAGTILVISFYSAYMIQRYRIDSERETLAQIQASQEAERSRLAREIHDELGQTIAAIKIQMARATDLEEAERAEALADVQSMIEEATDSVRRISQDLHPSLIENLGLESAIRWKLDHFRNIAEAAIDLRIAKSLVLDDLSGHLKTQIYRILQEALNNIQKHAKATRVSISFEMMASKLVMRIEDNGVGFEPGVRRQTLGLRSITERAALMSGEAIVESQVGAGTRVTCTFPLETRIGGVG